MVGWRNGHAPLRRDAQRNRQLLLDTAHALMARNGLGVSYEDIARTAGTGMGTVYRRFPEREDLMNALFAEHIDTVVDLARQAALTEDPWEGLCWFMTHQLELEADNRGLGELLRSSNQAPDLVARGRDEITRWRPDCSPGRSMPGSYRRASLPPISSRCT